MEGHIVKVVTELHNEARIAPVPYIPFQDIWFRLSWDLEGKIDDNKPHVMDTSEFFRVTKSKVGYRLREVLSGKSKTVRLKRQGVKDEECPRLKAYEFNREKLRRVAKKYGYELVTKLPSAPSSEGIRASNSTSKTHEKNVEKRVDTPSQVGYVSDSVTSIDIQTVLAIKALDPVTRGNCPICQKKDVNLVSQVLFIDGSRYDAVCMDCGGYLMEELRKRDRA